jgi:hypothetical protein
MADIDITGNPDALRAHKEASQKQTRKALELALSRLRNGNPKRVKQGTAITASAVAEEAGVDRSTLYRFHEPILSDIRKLNEKTQKKRLEGKRTELSVAIDKLRECRALLEEKQSEINLWARQNYALSHRLQELEGMIAERDNTIAGLQTRLYEASKLVALKSV